MFGRQYKRQVDILERQKGDIEKDSEVTKQRLSDQLQNALSEIKHVRESMDAAEPAVHQRQREASPGMSPIAELPSGAESEGISWGPEGLGYERIPSIVPRRSAVAPPPATSSRPATTGFFDELPAALDSSATDLFDIVEALRPITNSGSRSSVHPSTRVSGAHSRPAGGHGTDLNTSSSTGGSSGMSSGVSEDSVQRTESRLRDMVSAALRR